MITEPRLLLIAILALFASVTSIGCGQPDAVNESNILIHSAGWELIGDLTLPPSLQTVPAVLLLNQADGNRDAYAPLARALADNGIGSLRLDLRGHGESTNLGEFIPGINRRDPFIWDAEEDVAAALDFLRAHPQIDSLRLGVVGASYSGEESAESGRLHGYAKAYVLLSPGSLSDESIDAIDASDASWLFLTARADRYLTDITTSLLEVSKTVEIVLVPGQIHATDILEARPDIELRIASWFKVVL